MSGLNSGPVSLGIERLPTEVLSSVLLYLTAADIRTCRLVGVSPQPGMSFFMNFPISSTGG